MGLTMAQSAKSMSAREASLERRRALATSGKAALPDKAPARTSQTRQVTSATSSSAGFPTQTARSASRARRDAMSNNGKAGITVKDRIRTTPAVTTTSPHDVAPASGKASGGCGCGCDGTKPSCDGGNSSAVTAPKKMFIQKKSRQALASSSARAASLARREATSSRGKAGISAKGFSAAQIARAGNPDLSSRELAMTLRDSRSRLGKSGQKKSDPCGRTRSDSILANEGAEDASWKVGASETSRGQVLTGTMVGRMESVTGDEPSTCRNVTGTEYMGADIFRNFCKSEPGKMPGKVSVTNTSHGNPVSGNKIGRGKNVTGDEPGTCKLVTGNEYFSAKQSEEFCSTPTPQSPNKVNSTETRKGKLLTGSNVGRAGKVTGDETGASRELTGSQYVQPGQGQAPAKVGNSKTLRGGSVSGTMVGRGKNVTGDEPGSCRNVTGDDYISHEQYTDFCGTAPQPEDRKVGVSETLKGKSVTGTMTGRSGNVTGDEPGTCKSVTGTPYASTDQYVNYCEPHDTGMALARTRQQRSTPGSVMTGIQPGIAGKATGDTKGACENVSGTPYLGADQFAQACPATSADTSSPDFPQAAGEVAAWNEFSVTSPSGGAQQGGQGHGITGSQYEQGLITGSFGKANGKLTGTEEARFGSKQDDARVAAQALPMTSDTVDGRIKSRISGEGMDAGTRITGDDWDRGEHVTGTEGLSATRRNPTIRSSVHAQSVMQAAPKRNEEMQTQVSKVTGGSGNTEKGSLITYSGGARG